MKNSKQFEIIQVSYHKGTLLKDIPVIYGKFGSESHKAFLKSQL